MHADHQSSALCSSKVQRDKDGVDRQPADREDEHYDDDHTSDASAVAHPFSGLPSGPWDRVTGQSGEDTAVQGADDRQGKQVCKDEEAAVDDASVFMFVLLVLGEDSSVETLGPRLA